MQTLDTFAVCFLSSLAQGINVAEISSEDSPALLSRFSVEGYPTLIYISQPEIGRAHV